MAAAGKSKEADGAARCRRHPGHRHSAGVCPSCLRDRLSRLSAAAASANNAASSSSASSPRARSSGEESVASSAQLAPPCREARRTRPRLALLMRQEESGAEAAPHGAGHGGQDEEAAAPGEIKKAKRSNFWARLQQGSWYRKADGCSLAHSKAVGEKSAAAPKRAPLF